MSITVGELYNPDSKKRKRMALKYKFYRFFKYNPTLMAFKRQCAFCFTDLTDDSVDGVWEQSSFFDFNQYIYKEEHKCSCCGQNWIYNRGFTRGSYKFDEELKREMELYAPLREENKRRIDSMLANKKLFNDNDNDNA